MIISISMAAHTLMSLSLTIVSNLLVVVSIVEIEKKKNEKNKTKTTTLGFYLDLYQLDRVFLGFSRKHQVA